MWSELPNEKVQNHMIFNNIHHNYMTWDKELDVL